MSNTKPDSATFSSPKMSQPATTTASPNTSRHNNGHQQQARGKDSAARNPPSQRHARQSNRGKQNNSNQRSAATSADESATDSQATLAITPTKKPGRSARKQAKQQQQQQQQPGKIALLTRTAPEGEQQDLLARFAASSPPAQPPAGSRSSGKRNRRPQDSPPRTADDVVRTPTRRPNKQQFQPSPQQARAAPTTIYSPTPRRAHVTSPHAAASASAAVAVVPGRGGGSPMRSNHYAGASFNNSPAPATLPLPPSFLISPSSAASPPPSFHVPAVGGSSPSAPVSKRNSGVYVRDDDVFAMAASVPVSADRIVSQQQQQQLHSPVNAALSERSRQLEHMLAIGSGGGGARQQGQRGFSSTLDLAQPTDMASMFQKLRLIKEMSQNRAAVAATTVESLALTPV
ncbi:hypothetical protein GGI24_004090 [Coemansia furcata]|nr:hypothetical protein GGI24_004090 [Coemansia furcata]